MNEAPRKPERSTNPGDPASLLPFSKVLEYAPDHKPMENPHRYNDPGRPPLHTRLDGPGFNARV